jgi:hypothetical protein
MMETRMDIPKTPTKIKLTPTERKNLILDLKTKLDEGLYITFVNRGTKATDWLVLAALVSLTPGPIVDLSWAVAALAGRPYGGALKVLRGWKYDSPVMIMDEVAKLLGYLTPFRVQVL